MKAVIQYALRGYKRWISPLLPNACRFVPTCSDYALEAVELHGALRGSWLAVGRLLRCHPFARSGFDPVPHEGRGTQHVCNFGVVPESLAGVAFAVSAKDGSHSNSLARGRRSEVSLAAHGRPMVCAIQRPGGRDAEQSIVRPMSARFDRLAG